MFAQRFLVGPDKPSTGLVLKHVRASAAKTGRVFAPGYDLSGCPDGRIYDRPFKDWIRLVDDLRVTRDDRYLHHDDKPVLFVRGFFSDRFDALLAHEITDFFKADGRLGAILIGGSPWYWRHEADTE